MARDQTKALKRRKRRGQGNPESPTAAVLRWTWAAALSLLFVLAGLTLAFFGAVFVIVGAEQLLAPRDLLGAVAGVFVAGLGLLAIAVAVAIVFWARPRVVSRLSGR